jgi:hypothetical protein
MGTGRRVQSVTVEGEEKFRIFFAVIALLCILSCSVSSVKYFRQAFSSFMTFLSVLTPLYKHFYITIQYNISHLILLYM